MKQIKFDYEYIIKQEDVRKHIQVCEGKHTQQAIYSTFHDALTQICFGCKTIRTMFYLPNEERFKTQKGNPIKNQ